MRRWFPSVEQEPFITMIIVGGVLHFLFDVSAVIAGSIGVAAASIWIVIARLDRLLSETEAIRTLLEKRDGK